MGLQIGPPGDKSADLLFHVLPTDRAQQARLGSTDPVKGYLTADCARYPEWVGPSAWLSGVFS
jgi:hypothetical protein